MTTKSATRKTAVKRPPAKRAQRPPELEADSGPVEMQRPGDDVTFEQIPVFTIDGTTYSISSKPRANVALKMMWLMKTVGEERAAAEIIPEVLGEELMLVLMDYQDLTNDDLKKVFERVQGIIFNQGEDEEGN
jgi:hypothetical protein